MQFYIIYLKELKEPVLCWSLFCSTVWDW